MLVRGIRAGADHSEELAQTRWIGPRQGVGSGRFELHLSDPPRVNVGNLLQGVGCRDANQNVEEGGRP